MKTRTPERIQSIDVLRGIAMILMALDHVRDYFHIGANTDNPLDSDTTTLLLYFTRWITHFCAPAFVFLSGISVFLQVQLKSNKDTGLFLMKRGIWLVLAEWLIVSFGWTFNPDYAFIPFQVIWALGMSMICLGILLYLKASYVLILSLGLVIVLGHNVLDYWEQAPGFQSSFLWDLFHRGGFKRYPLGPERQVVLVYPFLPWAGLMFLGFAAGRWYAPGFTEQLRKSRFVLTGLGCILIFVLLRYFNLYGNPWPWVAQETMLKSLYVFLNVSKYPPSLQYLCIMMGPLLIVLAYTEKLNKSVERFLTLFGRTAFFYYILHLYLIHFLAVLTYFVRGHRLDELSHVGDTFPFLFVVPGEGFELAGVYGVWILVVALLYPVCKAYDRFKTANKSWTLLRYL